MKGDGIKYYYKMLIKSEKFLDKAFKRDPDNVPYPPKGMSDKEIIEEAIKLEKI